MNLKEGMNVAILKDGRSRTVIPMRFVEHWRGEDIWVVSENGQEHIEAFGKSYAEAA